MKMHTSMTLLKILEVLLFWCKKNFSKENFLYQVLPEVQDGKRDTLTRWSEFDKIFKKLFFL